MAGPSSSSPRATSGNGSGKVSRKTGRRAFKAIMRSYKFQLPKYDLPIRLRPWFVLFTAVVMFVLAFLGFTNFAHSLPLNNKVLHLVCLCVATTVFYFIFDVEEDARRIWIWRHAPLILTAIICFVFGGILSEVVQSLLPVEQPPVVLLSFLYSTAISFPLKYKEFQIGDIAANLLGSTIGLWTAYYLERYYRHRREIARLYRPVALDADDAGLSSSEDEDDARGTMLLPMHYDRRTPTTPGKADRIRIGDVWDERDELFGIGDSDSDNDEGENHAPPRPPSVHPSRVATPQQTAGPKIIVTSS